MKLFLAYARPNQYNRHYLAHPFGKQEQFHRVRPDFVAILGILAVTTLLQAATNVQGYYILGLNGKLLLCKKLSCGLTSQKQGILRDSGSPPIYILSGGDNEEGHCLTGKRLFHLSNVKLVSLHLSVLQKNVSFF